MLAPREISCGFEYLYKGGPFTGLPKKKLDNVSQEKERRLHLRGSSVGRGDCNDFHSAHALVITTIAEYSRRKSNYKNPVWEDKHWKTHAGEAIHYKDLGKLVVVLWQVKSLTGVGVPGKSGGL